MTVRELVAFCEAAGLSLDAPLRVSAFGGLGGSPAVESASVGFDWNMGSVLLTTKHSLWRKPDPAMTHEDAVRAVRYAAGVHLPTSLTRRKDGSWKPPVERMIQYLAGQMVKASARPAEGGAA